MGVSLALHYTYLTTLSTVECVADPSGVTKREGQFYKSRVRIKHQVMGQRYCKIK